MADKDRSLRIILIELDMSEDAKTLPKLNRVNKNNPRPAMKINSVDWTCPSLETERAGIHGTGHLILPAWQNLEAKVYSRRIQDKGSYSELSSYCLKNLDQIVDMDFDLLSDPRIREVIHLIADNKDKAMLLEVEAPFTVLAALINPMDLYLCMEDKDQEDLLIRILHQIADASAKYIQACLEAGCRIISLADPAGTMNLVGEKCYVKICGESEIYLMKRCRPYLRNAIIHICRRMSLSLMLADLVKMHPYHSGGSVRSHMDIFTRMADDPEILYTGMTCIHNKKPDLNSSYIIEVK